MKVLHAVFHRALVRPKFIVSAQHQGLSPGVHAQGNFVVFHAGFHVRRLLRFDKFALKGADFFRVEKLHHVERFIWPPRVKRADNQHVRVPLHHDVGVIRQPNSAVLGRHAFAVLQHHVVPLFIGVGARFAQLVRHANGLYRILALELPLQVVRGDERAQPGVKRADVIVLQVDLNKRFPVVVALVQVHLIKLVARKIKVWHDAERCHFACNVSPGVFKNQSIPGGGGVAIEVQAGVNFKVGRPNQLARCVVCPAV